MCSQPTGSSPALARWSSRRRAILRRFSFLFFSLFFLLFAILEKVFLLLFLAFFSSSFWQTWEGEATSDSEIISPLKIFVITWSPPDCGDQLSATRFECGSNGLKTRGYRHLGWDFSLPVFLLMIRFSRDGVGIHQTQSLQWVGRKNKILLAFNRFQINSVKGERPLWPLLQADRQGGGEQGEENQRRMNFLFLFNVI